MINEKVNEAVISCNNLDKSSSPYLLQHASNPIWWQEWSEALIKYAVNTGKPLFVSVGYATCHWCHVMASGAFSDNNTARYLNDHFINIKVDREQRPDIDQFLMDFINKQNGSGGWPLNVFLTPDLHPIFALTYAPEHSGNRMQSFLSISENVHEFFEKNSDAIPPFVSVGIQPSVADELSLVETLSAYYDQEHGGFGTGQKFPPHSTLLYLLYLLSINNNPSIKIMCGKTLDAMQLHGLNDHLQGGIFRYCVDQEWTIPHFEKMLYDQAMALWCYSLAYRVIGKKEYKIMAESILRCLDECFEDNGLYITGHDADTEHEEGTTYLWSYDELLKELLPDEFEQFCKVYSISKAGNFDRLNHLIRRNDNPLNDIEARLLTIRKTRKQPSRDDKILCGINSLLAISMIYAGRFMNKPDLEVKAASVIHNLLDKFWDGESLGHSYYKGVLQKQSFLFDAAAMLTAVSMLFENDGSWEGMMTALALYVETFREGETWTESKAKDFQVVSASWFDHPVPSSVSLAELGLTRVALLTGKEICSKEYRQPFQSDFYNLTVMVNNGQFHIFTSRKFIPWSLLPANAIQLRREHETDCYMGTCRPLSI